MGNTAYQNERCVQFNSIQFNSICGKERDTEKSTGEQAKVAEKKRSGWLKKSGEVAS
jgi:hypothetical protein